MRHNWKRLQDALNGFVRLVSREPLVDFGDYIVDRLQNEIKVGKVLSKYMRKVGIHGLLEMLEKGKVVDTYLHSYKYTSGIPEITAKLFLPWDKQLEARRVYGGCFPENVKRTVRVYADNVARVCEWAGMQNGYKVSVQVWFYRRAISGERVDGCRIERQTRYYPRDYRDRCESFLTVSCSFKR